MTTYWQTIIKSRYLAGTIDETKVKSYVPRLITQEECGQLPPVKTGGL